MRRVAVVERMGWDEAKREKVKKCLTIDYTSSDESELSEDEDGGVIKRFITKRLSWEGSKLRDLKDSLHLYYKTKLNPQRVKLQTERVFGEVFSQRSVPPNAPRWAIKSSTSPVATSTPARGANRVEV